MRGVVLPYVPLAVPYLIVFPLDGVVTVIPGQVCAEPLYVKWFVGVVTTIAVQLGLYFPLLVRL